MKNLKLILFGAVTIAALLAGPVFGLATIRVEPHGSYFGLPIMLTSPATFNVTVTPGAGNPTTDPHIFLVQTETSFNSMTGNVVVNWSGGSVTVTTWHLETNNAVKVPPGTDSGTGYTVAALRDHLNTTEPIYWAFESFLNGDITTTPTEFTVTLPATQPRMAVYVLGKLPGSAEFDNRSPPTQPGFVVPEPATLVATTLSIVALVGYAAIRRRRIVKNA